MDKELSAGARRIQAFFDSKGLAFEVLELPGSTRTAKEAAQTIGCEVAQIAKSLIFKDINSDEPILIIASGTNQVDLNKVEQSGQIQLGKADAKFVKEQVGFSIGGVPPVGHIQPVRTFIDNDIKQFSEIWAAAGSPFAVFKLKPNDLAEMIEAEWMDLKQG